MRDINHDIHNTERRLSSVRALIKHKQLAMECKSYAIISLETITQIPNRIFPTRHLNRVMEDSCRTNIILVNRFDTCI